MHLKYQENIMEENKTILLRLGLSLTKNGFNEKRYEWIGKETDNSYIVKLNNEESLLEKNSRRISKSKLLEPETNLIDSYRIVAYYVWCLPEDEEKAKSILNEKVISLAKYIRDEALQMFVHLEDK